ncbi:glycosyltransferase [Thermodesulfobacteriota bacterium]
MIKIIDLISKGLEHTPVNTGLIDIIRLAYPREKIYLYGERKNINEIYKNLDDDLSHSITLKPLELPARFLGSWKRIPFDFINIIKALSRGPVKEKHVVLASSTSFIIIFLKIVHILLLRNTKFHILLHYNLNKIKDSKSRNPFNMLQNLRVALSFLPIDTFRYIVLEKHIKQDIKRRIPEIYDLFDVIEHPFNIKELQYCDRNIKKKSFNHSGTRTFAFLGSVRKRKGFDDYIKIANQLKPKFKNKVDFHAIGSIGNQQIKDSLKFLRTQPHGYKLEREEYINRVLNIEWVCITNSPEHYMLSASGILLDAIICLKPIIAYQLPVLEGIRQNYGEIGYTVKNCDEMKVCIENIVENPDPERYNRFINNLRNLRNSRSPGYLYKSIKL